MSGRGRLYAFTVIRVRRAGFDSPYAIGYVDLDEGLRVFGHLDSWTAANLGQRSRVYAGPIGMTADGAAIMGTRIAADRRLDGEPDQRTRYA